MSWMGQLYETYEQAMQRDDMNNDYPMPVSHTIQNAHISITIDESGNFLRAKTLEKTQIVLPATERSAGRANGEAAHALADKIQYVAGDYALFGGLKAAYFDSYQVQLKSWVDSDVSHPSIEAVYKYVSKRSVVKDLIEHKIMWAKDGVLLTTWNIEGQEPSSLFKLLPKEKGQLDQGSALICWVVESSSSLQSKTWEDLQIQQSWIAFDAKRKGKLTLCYVSGQHNVIGLNHPAKLRHSGDKAKLISANDLNGYTFKGRFTDTKISIAKSGLQGASIGLITSQKAHNALRWLIGRKQSAIKNGDQVILTWAVSGKDTPSAMGDPIPYNDWDDYGDEDTNESSLNSGFDATPDLTIDLGARYANKLKKHMQGYRQDLLPQDTVTIMAIDSATPGRMGITYYRESMPGDYLNDISAWHNDFSWPQRAVKEMQSVNGKPRSVAVWPIQAPSPYTIMNAVYGDIIKSNESLKKQLYQRLLPCLVEGACIPKDIQKLAFHQACKSTNKEFWEWERNLGVACALYKGLCRRNPDKSKRKEVSMSLDTTITTRDYLYGRLLALAEKLETTALQVAGVKRPTTANRLMQRFADRPYSTWLTIYKQLDPYIRQLGNSRAGFLTNIQKEIDDIMGLFNPDDFKEDKALAGEFLLGFHCQRLALRDSKKTDKNTTELT